MKKVFLALLTLSLFSFTFFSCDEDDDDDNPQNQAGKYDTGVFVVNEGPFQSGTGSISFIGDDNFIENEIFNEVNSRPLGNVVQSASIHNQKVYVVVNNANKVEVVERGTFKSTGAINGLEMPRFFLGVDANKAYISQWGTSGGGVQVVNLSNLTIDKTIATGNGTERMALKDDKVYVVNSGGFGYDSTLVIIDTKTDAVENTIIVGPNPNSLQFDAEGNLWVLCGGKWNSSWTALEHKGQLVKVDVANKKVLLSLEFSSEYSNPGQLCINKEKDQLFFTYNGMVGTHSTSSTALNETPAISHTAYGLGIDPETNNIYLGDPKDYVGQGKVYIQ
jgi:YVTN family beta-propeller protein